MTNTDSALVPFGKYQGQPIDTLLADQNYLQWVTSQPGLMAMLQARHPRVFNIITIGAPETEDTPEHNKLQTMFLERDFQYAFLELVSGKSVLHWARVTAKLEHEDQLAQIKRQIESLEGWPWYEREQKLAQAKAELAQSKGKLALLQAQAIDDLPPKPPRISLEFECAEGYDVDFRVNGASGVRRYGVGCRIELKPQMGDDFAAVLRQMKRNGAEVLVIESFESVSCTLEQVQGIFGERKIITLAQIQAIKVRGVWPALEDVTCEN